MDIDTIRRTEVNELHDLPFREDDVERRQQLDLGARHIDARERPQRAQVVLDGGLHKRPDAAAPGAIVSVLQELPIVLQDLKHLRVRQQPRRRRQAVYTA